MSRYVDYVGVPTTPATYTATGTSSQMLAANSRKGLVVINLGTVNVSFGCGSPAVLNSGITLLPNGTWVMDQHTFSQAAINVISGGSAILSIQEYL